MKRLLPFVVAATLFVSVGLSWAQAEDFWKDIAPAWRRATENIDGESFELTYEITARRGAESATGRVRLYQRDGMRKIEHLSDSDELQFAFGDNGSQAFSAGPPPNDLDSNEWMALDFAATGEQSITTVSLKKLFGIPYASVALAHNGNRLGSLRPDGPISRCATTQHYSARKYSGHLTIFKIADVPGSHWSLQSLAPSSR